VEGGRRLEGREGWRGGSEKRKEGGNLRTREMGVRTKRCCGASLSPVRLSTEAEGEEEEGAVAAGALVVDLR